MKSILVWKHFAIESYHRMVKSYCFYWKEKNIHIWLSGKFYFIFFHFIVLLKVKTFFFKFSIIQQKIDIQTKIVRKNNFSLGLSSNLPPFNLDFYVLFTITYFSLTISSSRTKIPSSNIHFQQKCMKLTRSYSLSQKSLKSTKQSIFPH